MKRSLESAWPWPKQPPQLLVGRGAGVGQRCWWHPLGAVPRLCCTCPSRAGTSGSSRHPCCCHLTPIRPQQLELLPISHGPPSECDLPAGRAGAAPGTRRVALTPAQPELLSVPRLPRASQPSSAATCCTAGAPSRCRLLPTPALRAARPRAGVSLQVQVQWPRQRVRAGRGRAAGLRVPAQHGRHRLRALPALLPGPALGSRHRRGCQRVSR